MKFTAVCAPIVLSIALVALSGCASTPGDATPGPQNGECWTISGSITEDAVGESTAREALQIWVEQAQGLATELPAADWVETSLSSDRVRFSGGEQDWADATHLPGGWFILEAGSCAR
jgi:hypothetical protein